MATIRYRDRDSSTSGALFVAVGALAGIAAGVLLAQRYGGLSGLSQRVRERFGDVLDDEEQTETGARGRPSAMDAPDYDDEPLGDDADEGEVLEERVLEAFRNDPILAERAIDIGAIGTGIIELTGWVHADDETHHAVTVTRGVPGVATVVNRLTVREEEERLDERGRRYRAGDEETSPRWEGMGIGTGRPRQGTSDDPDRHADPKPILEERWQREQRAIEAAADDIDGLAERRAATEGLPMDRTGGAPVAPSGVPKSDHVADPASAEPVLREQTGRVDRNIRAD
ncbi:BON domain-containing protein [Roseisolibacter sp. H3M3-2]|uniref:BON domain-containing protein n=1 Tax=Roseisolibacter sp. H3M3-2 TaxID=3031323 RepID=UPI0023DBB5DB|nr:BON domain-containing protein [Roseisolibacter sp. H3M3-2]MDF1502560.1 BON domain-containing protein [Roseisolibacter sp. H3M3-2]